MRRTPPTVWPLSDVDRRIDGAQDERAEELHALEALADDVPRQRLDVDDDVGQFGQRDTVAAAGSVFSQSTICSRVQ